MSAPVSRLTIPANRAASTIVGIAVVLFAVAAPWLLDLYAISLASRILALALLAVSVHLLASTAGLASLGQAGLFAVGGYTAAIIAREVTTVGVVQVIAATGAGALVAAVTGIAVVRTRGIVFVMVTLAAGQLTYTAAEQWRGITHGGDGLTTPMVRPFWGMPELANDGLVYLWVLTVFLVAYLATTMLLRSPLGLTLRATGENETRLRALGYAVTPAMLVNYTVSGALAGAAGALWVTATGLITASDVNFTMSAVALVAVVIGGLRATWGAVAGAAIVVLVRDVLAGNLTGPLAAKGPILLGLLLVACVYLFPGGISGLFSRTRSVLPLVVGPQRDDPGDGTVPESPGTDRDRIPAQDSGPGREIDPDGSTAGTGSGGDDADRFSGPVPAGGDGGTTVAPRQVPGAGGDE